MTGPSDQTLIWGQGNKTFEVFLEPTCPQSERAFGKLLPLRTEFEDDAAMELVKCHAKYARQNGIHASPTFMIDGLVDDNVGSRDSNHTWLEAFSF